MKTFVQIFAAVLLLMLLAIKPVYSQGSVFNLNHEPGHIDSTFGTGGTSRITPAGMYGLMGSFGQRGLIQLVSMVIGSDGKIVEAGYSRSTGWDEFAVARFDSDGTPDNTFGTNGVTSTHLDTGNTDDAAFSVALQPDGKIIAAGFTQPSVNSYYEFGVARFNSNGTLDNTFGTVGYVKFSIPGSDNNIDRAASVVVQKDGKIVVSGLSEFDSSGVVNYKFAMARLNPDGSIDSTFGTKGFLIAMDLFVTKGNDLLMNTIIQPDGKFLIAISAAEGGNNSYLIRVNDNGTLDNSFTINGTVNLPAIMGIDGYDSRLQSIALSTYGKIVAAGYDANSGIFTTRFNADGTFDMTFGKGGFSLFTDNSGEANWDAYSVALQTDGKVIAAGSSELKGGGSLFQFVAVRFDSSGAIDSSFGTYGCARTFINGGSDSNDVATAVAIQADGKVVLGGGSEDVYNSTVRSHSFAVARFYGGNSKIAKIELNNKTISFGSVESGTTKDTLLSISNNGYDTLKISLITSTNKDFVSKTNSVNILPDRSFTDTVAFTPDSSGYFQGKIIVSSNALNSSDTISVNGTGILIKIEFLSNQISFGNTTVGKSKDTVITIFNKGKDSLVVSNITSTNPNFSLKKTSANVAAGQSFTDTVTFKPDSSGYFQGKIIVISNAPSSPDSVSVNGTGTVATGLGLTDSQLPKKYSLFQNYPNPFNPSTMIRYALPSDSKVTIKVYNLLGQEIRTLLNTTKSAGNHEIKFNAYNLASGIYFYRISARSTDGNKQFVSTKKLLLLK